MSQREPTPELPTTDPNLIAWRKRKRALELHAQRTVQPIKEYLRCIEQAIQTDDAAPVTVQRTSSCTSSLIINVSITGNLVFYWIPDSEITQSIRNELDIINNHSGMALDFMEDVGLWDLLAKALKLCWMSTELVQGNKRISNTYYVKGLWQQRPSSSGPIAILNNDDSETTEAIEEKDDESSSVDILKLFRVNCT